MEDYTPERASRLRIVMGHFSLGIFLGIFLGICCFLAEPLWLFRGRYASLGAPLFEILALYIATGLIGGAVASLFLGIVSSLSGRLARPARYVPFYGAVFCFILLMMLLFRGLSAAEIRFYMTSVKGIGIIAALIVLLSAALLLSKRFDSNKRFNRLQSPGAFLIACSVGWAALFLILFGNMDKRKLPEKHSVKSGSPNVVMIVLDALRPDHLSAYGYERKTTPNLERLSNEGILFINAHSHGNRTQFAMPALFTGMYHPFHGAINVGPVIKPLPDSTTTIAEIFDQAGYATIGLLTNVYIKSAFNMTQGFDVIEEFNNKRYSLIFYQLFNKLGFIESPEFSSGYADARAVTDEALQWLNVLKDKPFFLLVYIMDTHHPYTPPPPYDTMFDAPGGADAKALFAKTADLVAKNNPGDITKDELNNLIDYYDGCIRYADEEIGRILESVRELSKDRETMVIVTADHGDEFLEHGCLYHNNILIEELIHIPLIIWNPNRYPQNQRIETLVRHIDLLPTIAEILDVPVPKGAMGVSLESLLTQQETERDVESFAVGPHSTSLIYRNWKILEVDSANSYQLFDLASDPREKTDLSTTEADIFAEMKQRLDRILIMSESYTSSAEVQLDPDTIRQLKALGYL